MQALVILLVIVPIYGVTILSHLRQSQPYSLDNILFYTCVIAGPLLIMISHYLHNALQVILLVYLIRSGAI